MKKYLRSEQRSHLSFAKTISC